MEAAKPKQHKDNMEIVQPSPWESYITSRFQNPHLYKATYLARTLGRDLTEGEQTSYKNEVVKSGLDIQDQLGIDDSFFQDKRCAEVFLAICDSWTLNQKRLERFSNEDPTYATERDFLVHVARSVTGSKSAFNKQQAYERMPHADYYLNVGKLTGTPTQEERVTQARIEKIVNLQDDLGTETLRTYLHEDNNVTQLIRTKLGVSFDTLGEIWDVMVINNPANTTDKTWGDKSLSIAGAFVTTYREKPTLFIQRQTLDKLLQGDKTEEQLVEHELTHIFRNDSILMGENGHLGQMYNEYAATLISGEAQGHIDAAIFFRFLNMTQGPMERNNMLSGEADQVFATALLNNSMEDYYQYISDHFGLRTFLLLTTYYPDIYYRILKMQTHRPPFHHSNIAEARAAFNQYYGIEIEREAQLVQQFGDKPEDLANNRSYYGMLHLRNMISLSLLDIMIREAMRINPDAIHNFKDNLHAFGSEYIDTVLKFYSLPPVLQRLVQEEAEKGKTTS